MDFYPYIIKKEDSIFLFFCILKFGYSTNKFIAGSGAVEAVCPSIGS